MKQQNESMEDSRLEILTPSHIQEFTICFKILFIVIADWSLSGHQLQMHQLELQILSILLVMGDIVPHPCITQDLGIIVFGLFQSGSFLINIWIYYALILKNMIINKIPFTALPIALKFQ